MEPTLRAGMRVRARYKGRERWYEGKIRCIQRDGSVTIDYDDGDEETIVEDTLLRVRPLEGKGGRCSTPGCTYAKQHLGLCSAVRSTSHKRGSLPPEDDVHDDVGQKRHRVGGGDGDNGGELSREDGEGAPPAPPVPPAPPEAEKEEEEEEEDEDEDDLDRPCGTPGCTLRDWHRGLCTPLLALAGKRERLSKKRWEPEGRRAGSGRARTGSGRAHSGRADSVLWVQCDECSKWRLLVDATVDARRRWVCEMSPGGGSCDDPEPSACHELCRAIPKDVYYVEKILADRPSQGGGGGKREFLVRWLGWGAEHDSWEPERHIEDRTLISDYLQPNAGGHNDADMAAHAPTSTTDVREATWAFVAPCPSVGGRGLFARAPLQAGQAICEYGGPRLPLSLQTGHGMYALQLPRTRIIIDGNGDSLSKELDYTFSRCAAIFANHSTSPNARLECWPWWDPTTRKFADEFGLSSAMWIVATEAIPAGAEIRINYEAGDTPAAYWGDEAPEEEAGWRDERVAPPATKKAGYAGHAAPAPAYAAVDVLDAIREATSRPRPGVPAPCKNVQLPARIVQCLERLDAQPVQKLPLQEADERILALAPLLARSDNRKTWGLLATHLPGWSGRQCYQRWVATGRRAALQDEVAQTETGNRRATVTSTILRTMQ